MKPTARKQANTKVIGLVRRSERGGFNMTGDQGSDRLPIALIVSLYAGWTLAQADAVVAMQQIMLGRVWKWRVAREDWRFVA